MANVIQDVCTDRLLFHCDVVFAPLNGNVDKISVSNGPPLPEANTW